MKCGLGFQFYKHNSIVYLFFVDADMLKFCVGGERTGKSVYLSNANYPWSENSIEPTACQCTVQSSLGKGVTIEAVDIVIRRRSKKCFHEFRIQDSYGIYGQYSCGMEGLYGYRELYQRMVSNVSLTLETGVNGSCFVWIHMTGIRSS